MRHPADAPVKAILWDNDGVLVDTERLYFRATRKALATVGANLTRELYIDLFLEQGQGAWHLAEEQGVPPSEIEHLIAVRNALYDQSLREEPLAIDGAREALAALHGKFVMGIVTSSRRDHFETIHRTTDLLQYFDFVLTSEAYSRYKPDPEPYRLGVERTGFDRADCVVIEDSPRGLAAAVAAGIRCLVIPTALTAGSDFADAWKVLEDIRQAAAELLAYHQAIA